MEKEIILFHIKIKKKPLENVAIEKEALVEG